MCRRFRRTYHIRDFGAIGDGVTKDTAAFQRALDACAVNGGGEDLEVLGSGFLRIKLTVGGNTNTAADPVPGLAGYPEARHLSFTNVRLRNVTGIGLDDAVPYVIPAPPPASVSPTK